MSEIAKIGHFRSMPELTGVDPRPRAPWPVGQQASSVQAALAALYNRIGGLMEKLGALTGVEVPAILAVFYVESGGRALTPGRALIRFEGNLLFSAWGAKNPGIYRPHFKHGGFEGWPGKPWENHQFRDDAAQAFQSVHRNQETEYAALSLATRLAGETTALSCISIGGCQILISNHGMLGYSTPREMYDAFQASESAHVLGFFDYCAQRDLFRCLQAKRWTDFARYYNGPGNAPEYGKRIEASYQAAASTSPQLPPVR
jgi:hypothetical protein